MTNDVIEIDAEDVARAIRRQCRGRTAPESAFKMKNAGKAHDIRQSTQANAVVPRWQSKDPKTGEWKDYGDMLSAGLEEKFQKGRRWVKFQTQGTEFEIDLTPGAMLEYIVDDSSYAPREVQRSVPHRYTCEGGPLPFQLAQQGEPALERPWKRGQKVEGLRSRGSWEFATIADVDEDGAVTVSFKDGDKIIPREHCSHLRALEKPWKRGQKVEVLRSSGSWDGATIADVDENGDLTVSFKDGDKMIPQGYCRHLLRSRESRPPPEIKERRVDSMLGGRAVTYSEMSRGLSGQGLTQNQLQSYWMTLPVAAEVPVCSVSALSRPESMPMLFVRNQDGSGAWNTYAPDMRSVLVIAPGAGVQQNAKAYQGLREAGWDVHIAFGQKYDKSDEHPDGYLYPPGWEHGEPDLHFNGGKNLATLADKVVAPLIKKLVAVGKGPAAIIAGSRGGQVTVPRLWAKLWRGPTLVINGGCVKMSEVPAAPVRLVLLTGGLDFFETNDPQMTAKQLHKEDASRPVLMYHDPREGHMPRHFGDVVEPLLDVSIDEGSFQATAKAVASKPCILSQPKAKRHGVVLKVL